MTNNSIDTSGGFAWRSALKAVGAKCSKHRLTRGDDAVPEQRVLARSSG